MTLKRVRPATINTIKLFAFALFAMGIAGFAYLSADHGKLARPPVASAIAWTGGFVLLALDAGKRRTEQAPGQRQPTRTPDLSRKIQPLSPHLETRRKPLRSAHRHDHTSPVAEYTHQISHF
jgi:hypothetical protein